MAVQKQDSVIVVTSDSIQRTVDLSESPQKEGSKASSSSSLQDTKSVVKPYTAVDSLYLPLDSLKLSIYAFQILDKNSYVRTRVGIDTTLSRFDINNPVMKRFYAGSYLGNAGLSYYPIGFEQRKRPSDFLFTDQVDLYIHHPEEQIYYQTKVPYTLIDYSSAGSKKQNESIFKLVHSQNINKKWNVGLDYDIISSVGQYANQNAADNGFSLFSAYRGAQYSMYTGFTWNNVRMKENGGLSNLDYFYENDDAPETYSVRSMSGETVLRSRIFYLMQSYSFKKLSFGKKSEPKDSTKAVDVSRFTLVQTFKYEWNKREFSDTATYAFVQPNMGTTQTYDSLYYRRASNHFELMLKEQERKRFTAGFSVGLLTEFDRYNSNIIPDTTVIVYEPYTPPSTEWGGPLPGVSRTDLIIAHRATTRYVNTALTGRFFNHTGRYLNWDFNGRFYFTGHKIGDLNINGTVQVHYYTSKGRNSLLLGGSLENAQPSYFLEKYESNWLAWDNDFRPSQEIRLRGEFLSPHRKFKVGAYVSQLNNYIYFGADARPVQTSEPLLVGTALIEKDIKWGHMGFRFKVYGQYSSNQDIVPLPAAAVYQSTYFEAWLVRNVLKMQLGWDFNYHTKYYAYAYMPSSGMFYLQQEQKIGNYPFFDVFINLQLRRARIFVKTDGLNTLLSNSIGKDYFMVYRYPLNELRVKFGVSWAFYD